MSSIINSNVLSDIAKLSHHSLLKLILKYEKDLKEFGELKSHKEKTRGRNSLIFQLNENQIKYLILLMKNSNESNELKKKIIKNEDFLQCLQSLYKHKYTEGYVYAIQKENKLVKIGVSVNPEKRINTIRTHSAEVILNIFISEKTNKYKEIERKIHQMFKKERVMGEWFNVDFQLAKQRIEDFSKIIPKTIVPMVEYLQVR